MATLSEFNTILTKLQNPTRTSAEDKELSNMMNGVEFGLSFANDEKNLKNLNFSKLTLTNVTFNRATIMNCNFNYSTLEKCSFEGAHIGASSNNREETTFDWAILEGTNFKNTSIWNTSFYGAYLKDATFENSNISGVTFADSILLNAKFDNDVFELYAGVTDFDGAVTIQSSFDNIEAIEDDDVQPIYNLTNNHNPSKHIVVIKGLDEAKISEYFKKKRHMREIIINYKMRPLYKLAIDSLSNEEKEYAKNIIPHLFPGQVGGRRKSRKSRKYKKTKKYNKYKKHTRSRK